MSAWSDVIDARLAALYAQVPDVQCKGLCADSCGPIDMHPRERQRLREAGVRIPGPQAALEQLVATGEYSCPALVDGRCGVYAVRPMICRAWGASEALPCEHGCRPPNGRLLTDAETRALVEASKRPEEAS